LKLTLALVAVLTAAFIQPALAQGKGHGNDDAPGQGRGQSKGQGQGQGQGQGRGNSQAAVPPGNVVIADRDRNTVYSYYRNQYAAGNCPPGLAKKNNGCLPPGQAKKLWAMGQPLPGSVAFYPLPGALLAMLSPAPAGYQYVQVANDILLMAIGTRMIAAAIADLSAM
jgi:Ni/Co efflux regulator RcnB